jgi:hypothetical protein
MGKDDEDCQEQAKEAERVIFRVKRLREAIRPEANGHRVG